MDISLIYSERKARHRRNLLVSQWGKCKKTQPLHFNIMLRIHGEKLSFMVAATWLITCSRNDDNGCIAYIVIYCRIESRYIV